MQGSAKESEGTAGRLSANALVGIGLLALAARLLFLLVGSRADLFHGLFLDSKFFAETAAGIRLGHGAGDHPYLLSPLYPYFLALFPGSEGEVATSSAMGVRAVQAVFGAGTCVLAGVIAQRLAGRVAGAAAGVVAALFGPLIHFDAAVLVECLQGFFLTAAVALAATAPEGSTEHQKGEPARWLCVGLALGVSAALRPTGLAIAFALAVLLVVEAVARHRAGALRAGALLLGTALVVLPFTVRNVTVAGEPVLLSANGGMNFWAGNHLAHDEGPLAGPASQGVFTPPPDYDLQRDTLAVEIVIRALGRPVSYREASAWWRNRALEDVRAEPLTWLRLLARKAALFLHPVEIPQLGASFAWHAERAWPLRFPLDARWVLIFALAAPFALTLRGGRAALMRARWPIVAFLTYAAAICLFFVTGRYRAPVMPVAIALAAATVVGLVRVARTPGRRARGLAALVVLLGLGLASDRLYGAGRALHVASSSGIEERHIGMTLVEEGRYEEAIEVYRAALEEHDDARTRANLARALRAAGRTREAYEEYQRVIARNPRDAFSLYNLGNLLSEDWERPKEAEGLFRRAVEILPRFAEAHFNLGVVLLQQRRFEEAAPAIQTALQIAPPSVPWRAEAERAYLIALDPDRPRQGEPLPERE